MSTPAPGLTPLAQLCLAATAAAAARGLRVLYLDSTGGFSANRLLQLLTLHNAATTESVRAALAAVRAVRVSEVYAALAVLDELLRGGPAAAPALLVCDSASALLSPLLNHKLQQGRSLLLSLGGGFKAVADELRVAVLITNHTVSGRDREQGTLRPALGEAWKSQPHLRIQFSAGTPTAARPMAVNDAEITLGRGRGRRVAYVLTESGLR